MLGHGYRRRKVMSALMVALSGLGAFVAVALLLVVLSYVLVQGGAAVNVDFFTQAPKPVGEPGGGMAPAIVGTLLLVGLACVLGLPVGIGAGVYLAEYGGDGRLARVIRYLADVLTGIPSITIGLFVYTLVVRPMRSFSAVSGGIALAIIMLPVVVRTTEEMLRLVPASVREGGLALGIPRWKTVLRIALPSARSGILTGALLAVARVAGETAPLLFTAFGNRFWNLNPLQPIAALPLQVFTYAIAPYDDWHRQAWAGALVLVGMVLIVSVTARYLSARAGLGR
jgi:phosphate transport system permease protein